MPDALELETLVSKLQKQYTLELEPIWSDQLTLGELFTRIRA